MAKNSSTPSGAFDRDFGYLLPFLDKVAAAAAELPDASARAELTQLMAEEKARWARIRELLSGASGRGSGQQAPPVQVEQVRDGPPGGAVALEDAAHREALGHRLPHRDAGTTRPQARWA